MKTSWELYEQLIASAEDSARCFSSAAASDRWMNLSEVRSPDPCTLRVRRASKYFNDRYVALRTFDGFFNAVHEVDRSLWPGCQQPVPLETYIFVSRVEGRNTGFYKLTPEGLFSVADLEVADPTELVLQPEFAGAAAIVFVVGSIQAATQHAGDHGYRILLERAGSAAHTMWLRALDAGLQGCIFAGLLPAQLRTSIGVDGFRRAQLLGVAIGHADDDASARWHQPYWRSTNEVVASTTGGRIDGSKLDMSVLIR